MQEEIYQIQQKSIEFKNRPIIFNGHMNQENSAEFFGDGKYLVSASNDSTIRIWDLEQQKQIKCIHCSTPVQQIAISRDEKFLIFIGSRESKIQFYLIRDCSILKLKELNQRKVIEQILFTSDSKNILSRGLYIIWIWNIISRRILFSLDILYCIQNVSLSEQMQCFVVNIQYTEVNIWNFDTRQLQYTRMDLERGDGHVVQFSRNSLMLATCGYKKSFKIWDIRGFNRGSRGIILLREVLIENSYITQDVNFGFQYQGHSIVFTPDCNYIICFSNKNQATQFTMIFDVHTGQEVKDSIILTENNYFLAYSQNFKAIAFYDSKTNQINIWKRE